MSCASSTSTYEENPKWSSVYENLERWLREHEGKEPSESSTDPEEKFLAIFVRVHRRQVMNNSCSVLCKEKLKRLPALASLTTKMIQK